MAIVSSAAKAGAATAVASVAATTVVRKFFMMSSNEARRLRFIILVNLNSATHMRCYANHFLLIADTFLTRLTGNSRIIGIFVSSKAETDKK